MVLPSGEVEPDGVGWAASLSGQVEPDGVVAGRLRELSVRAGARLRVVCLGTDMIVPPGRHIEHNFREQGNTDETVSRRGKELVRTERRSPVRFLPLGSSVPRFGLLKARRYRSLRRTSKSH